MTPAGFPHSEIYGSMPACGSPWLIAAYHVFLRRPVPWHPPCALSNLIVTNLSSCQRIDFSIFVSFLSPETNCKIVRILLRSCVISNTFATGFFTRCFPSGCAVFKVQFRPSRFARWLPARIFQILCASRFAFAHPSFSSRFYSIPENDTGSRRRTVIRPLLWIFFYFSLSAATQLSLCIDLE